MFLRYNTEAVQNAAIAQSVERILGKDEVASSNLASSSKKKPGTPTSFGLSSFSATVAAITETDTKTDTGQKQSRTGSHLPGCLYASLIALRKIWLARLILS